MNHLTAAANFVEAIKNQREDLLVKLRKMADYRADKGTFYTTKNEERQWNELRGQNEALQIALKTAEKMYADMEAADDASEYEFTWQL